MNEEVQKMIDGIGCIAELLGVFYQALQKGGFSEDQAFALSSNLLDTLLSSMFECCYGEESEEEE